MANQKILGHPCIRLHSQKDPRRKSVYPTLTTNPLFSGRLVGGIGLGLTLSITPVYLVEVCSTHNRSTLGVIPPLFTQVEVFTVCNEN